MKKILFILVLVMMAAGCETVPTSIVLPNAAARPADRITLGMTRAAVVAIMDGRVVVGYEIDPDTGMSRSVEARNLYSSEIVKVKDVPYQVDRYIVRPAMKSARIAETELFPIVYKAGLVVAVGRDGLASLITSGAPVKAAK